MFFWFVLEIYLFAIGIYKLDGEWVGVEGMTYAWVIIVIVGMFTSLAFLLLVLVGLLSISTVSILTLAASFIIIPYISILIVIFHTFFEDIIKEASLKNPLGKYWWFFITYVTTYQKAEWDIITLEEKQWLSDNLGKQCKFVMLDDYCIYFRNKEDAILFRLSV